jgi:hypothetical protein
MPELGASLIDTASGASAGILTGPFLLGILALALYALLSGPAKNDDDDSTPGGGLMQPVA